MAEGIRFARAEDGVLIAFRDRGQGPPIVVMPGWVSHLELETTSPLLGRYEELLSRGGRRRIVLFDARGCGLSDREVTDISAAARARDIAAVVEALDVDQITLHASSLNSPVAILYAAAHPQRVAKLILYAAFARYRSPRPELGRAFAGLIRAEWGIGSRTIVDFIAHDADKEQADAMAAYQKAAASGDVAAAIFEESLFTIDVREEAKRIVAPTLILHRRDDPAVPFECGRELASLVPDAEFVALPGDQHMASQGDVKALLDAIDAFVGDETGPALEPTAGLQIILFTDMSGSTALTNKLGDARAQELLRVHDTIVRDALRRSGGTEIKHTGDGIMARFPSASGALQAALAAQRGFAEHNAGHPDVPIRVRVGLNAGEPVAEGDDLFGSAVQAAARITEHARPGQILVSDVVRQLAAGKGFAFANRGKVALKGFPHRFRLFEVEAAR